MPTYAYRCENGHQYELREGFDAPARQACVNCGAPAKRVIFPPPIVFKGSGFYITDSRKGSSATVTSDGTGPSTSSSTTSTPSSSGESKPASTPAPAASSSDD